MISYKHILGLTLCCAVTLTLFDSEVLYLTSPDELSAVNSVITEIVT